jgi:hypothetical protein
MPLRVTVAAKRWSELPDFLDAESVGRGTPVPLPEGLRGMVVAIGPAAKAAAGPDELRAFIEFAVQTVGPIARDVAVAALSAWVVERLHHPSPRQPHVSVHTEVRVWINGEPIDPADHAAVEQVVDAGLNDTDVGAIDLLAPPNVDLRPQDVGPVRPAGLTDEEWNAAWVDYWVKESQRHRAMMEEEINAAREKPALEERDTSQRD